MKKRLSKKQIHEPADCEKYENCNEQKQFLVAHF